MKASLTKNQSGVALVTAILVLALASGLMAGMFAALLANQRSHASDRDQSVAYAAAHAGLEKLTAGLAQLFATDFSPSAAQIANVDSTPPDITGFSYSAPGGAEGSGYDISFTADPGPGPNTGNPLALPSADITTGPFEGFKGLITPYTLTVTARSTTGNSEVRLRRELQTVAVPVFQFGIFGDKTLGFHAGPNFDFGGRVHTNESLYLASGDGSTLTFRDKITAVIQVVRNTLTNGRPITATNHEGNVSIPKVIGGSSSDYRNLLSTESSGTLATPWSGWKNLSEVTYRTNIRTAATGAKRLDLPLTANDLGPIELLRRPAVDSDEDTSNPAVYGQRYFAQASLRILLSDREEDLTGLPTVTGDAPLDLSNPAGYTSRPIAESPGTETQIGGANQIARVSAISGSTLTIQYLNGGTWSNGSTSGGTWTAGVPSWLRWTSTTYGAGTAFSCGTYTQSSQTFSNCSSHAQINNNTTITIVTPYGTLVTTTRAQSNSGTNNILLNTSFSIVKQTWATRRIFVGEDPVVCTGFAGSSGSVTQLTGCTWPSGSSIATNDPVYTGATWDAGTKLLNGYIKIEKQNSAGTWSDVTLELLNLGISGPNQQGDDCGDPTPNAVLRFQRLRDNGYTSSGACTSGSTRYDNSTDATDYWPLTIFDAREGNSRLLGTTAGMNEGGLMGYVALDMANFKRWVAGSIGTTGSQVYNNNGYIIYFSDRRGDHDENNGDVETGEYGNEDFINPANQTWAKTNALETGEDVNENGTLETYGETPHALAGTGTSNLQFDANARPWSAIPLLYSGRGRMARPVLFRRALKVINGGISGSTNNLPTSGVAVVAENPIYVQGNFNATAASVTAEPNVPAALIGDAITLLSNAFDDYKTFTYPNDENNRNASDTGYRFAMVTGKTVPFPKPNSWGVEELGSDGGVHNFMKMLEDWGGTTLRYRGSMVSLYYSRQAIGIYRADANIYGAPTRGYNFDTDFLSPPLLPPGTPMFRDINTLKFRQILRPNQ